jgi:hypothetical protein
VLAVAFELYASRYARDPDFCILLDGKHMQRIRQVQGRKHNDEKIVVLGDTACWSYGCLSDVSSWRIVGYDCSPNRDQPSGIVGCRTEDSFQLAQREAHLVVLSEVLLRRHR